VIPHNVLVIVFADNACAQLGIILPLTKLEAEGKIRTKMYTTGMASLDAVAWADVVVLQRVFSHLDMEILLEARKQNKPVIYDIDDNLLDVPLSLGPIAELYADEGVRHNIRMFLTLATLVKTSTVPLAQALAPFTQNPPFVLSPMNPDELYAPVRHSHDNVFRFIYAGNAENYHAVEKLAGRAIQRIMEDYGDKVHFYFFGGVFRELRLGEKNATFIPLLPMHQYMKVLIASTADGAIACLEDSAFNRCKSNVKFREYGARGLAGLYSNIPVYAEWVEHEQTGLLVENTEASWYSAMKYLVDHTEDARRMGKNARLFAENNFRLENYAHAWMDQILTPLLSSRSG